MAISFSRVKTFRSSASPGDPGRSVAPMIAMLLGWKKTSRECRLDGVSSVTFVSIKFSGYGITVRFYSLKVQYYAILETNEKSPQFAVSGQKSVKKFHNTAPHARLKILRAFNSMPYIFSISRTL